MNKGHKDRVRTQFGKTADEYIRADDFAGGEDLEATRELLAPTADDLMLDVATGGGHTALYFAPLVKSVVASDLTIRMLKKAQEFIAEQQKIDNVIFREADAEDLPFPSGAFTLLTCRIAPHHFLDLDRALREFNRVLRHRGRMAIVDTLRPNNEDIADFQNHFEKLRDPSHHRTYSLSDWIRRLEEAGFINIKTRIIRKEHDFQRWMKRTHMTTEAEHELCRLFMGCDERIQAYFQIASGEGALRRFSDEKVLLYAEKTPK